MAARASTFVASLTLSRSTHSSGGVEVGADGTVAGGRDAVVEVEEANVGGACEGEEAGLLACDLTVALDE